MKRIGLLSDTHSFLDKDILNKYFKNVDEIWHAGDIGNLEDVTDIIKNTKPLRAVFGNIDNHVARAEFPLDNRFECEGFDVWITHIGGYPNRYNKRVRDAIRANPPKLFITGHSHILKVMPDSKLKLLHVNPGAAGNHGFHKMKTIVRFTINGSNIKDMEVVELGKRGETT